MTEDASGQFNRWCYDNGVSIADDLFGVEPDAEQIATFCDVVFGYCDGLIPLRSFVEKGQGRGGRPHNIWIRADGTVCDQLGTFAQRANRDGAGAFVIPGTVAEQGQARAEHVLQMQAIVVDLDTGDVPAKLDHVAGHLDTPTLVVESGGRTAEGASKLHVWWKLTEAAEGADLAELCRLRGEIAIKVRGDTHFRSAHQPIRIAGSVYHKGSSPRLVQIREQHSDEVELEASRHRGRRAPVHCQVKWKGS